MQGKHEGKIRKFARDTEALVTMQVVMFSVMIFGGIGLMMDFGRAYSAHSQMQSYIDQVALAAARELDQTSGAVGRATSAAGAVAGNSLFVDTGDFSYDEIIFLTDTPTDANGEFDEGLVSTLNTQNSLLATHVLVRSSTESVALQLLKFAASDSNGLTDIALRTKAVATSRKIACGGLSPLVMCNPFEGNTTTSFREAIGNGYRMKLTADVLGTAKPESTATQIQLGLLKNPVETMHVRNAACADDSLLPGKNTMNGLTDEELRDICLLATVDTGLSCVNDSVIFKAADPYTVTTGLNVIFDMFDDSMQDIMDISEDSTFPSPFVDNLGVSISRSSLFYPDAVASKGKISRESFQQHIGEQIFSVQANAEEELLGGEAPVCPPDLPPFLCPTAEAPSEEEAVVINSDRDVAISNLQDDADAYAPQPGTIESYSRLNYVADIGERTEWGPAPDRVCLLTESCTFHGAIYGQQTGSNEVDAYGASFYQPYILREIADVNGTDPFDPANAPLVDIDYITNGELYHTYYDFYVAHEIANPDLQLDTAVDGTTFPAITALALSDSNAGANKATLDLGTGQYGLSTAPTNFTSVYGAASIGTEHRRRQRVTVVNCSAAESYETATGEANSDFTDAYVADVVDVIDIFLLTPPQVTACSTVLTDDPHNNFLCDNQDITSVDLDVEFIDSASANEVAFDSRTFAVLVH